MSDDWLMPSVSRVGNVWLLHDSGFNPRAAKELLFDTNLIIATRQLLEGRAGPSPTGQIEFLRWARRVMSGPLPGQNLVRPTGIPLMIPGLLEASWPHTESLPTASVARYHASCVHEVMSWGQAEAALNFSQLLGQKPKRPGAHSLAWGRVFADEMLMLNFWKKQLFRDWAAILLLMQHLHPRASSGGVDRSRKAYRAWRADCLKRRVGASAEVKMMAQYVLFGGNEAALEHKRQWQPENVLKMYEWRKQGVLATARNLAMDANVLQTWRWSNQQPLRGGHTVLATMDSGLAALHGLTACRMSDRDGFVSQVASASNLHELAEADKVDLILEFGQVVDETLLDSADKILARLGAYASAVSVEEVLSQWR